jgi:prephenate dehydrogenase
LLLDVSIICPVADNVKPHFSFSTLTQLCYNVLTLKQRRGLELMRVAIIGLGLIGGSIGLALSRLGADIEVVGFARKPRVASRALALGVASRIERSAASAVNGSDLVIIATSPMAVKGVMSEIRDSLRKGAIVTDVASTKAAVMDWAEELLPASVSFIGGHPMAGREASGIEAVDGDLFQGCTYCLVPGRNATKKAVALLEALVRRIGAVPLSIDAAGHDRLVAGISHLPLLISVALVSVTAGSPSWTEMARLAATGYHDVSRLASGDPLMGRDICLTNKEPILRWLDDYIEELKRLRSLIDGGSGELEQAFVRAREAREKWLRK